MPHNKKNNLINPVARVELMCLIERFLAGNMTNVELSDQIDDLGFFESEDLAVAEISKQLQFTFDDPYRTFYYNQLHSEQDPSMERIRIFLHSKQPYKWPEVRLELKVIFRNLLNRCLFRSRKRKSAYKLKEIFDEMAWPFCTVEEFESQKLKHGENG